MSHYSLIISGKAVETAGYAEVTNPSTGDVAGLMPLASPEQLEQAIAAAKAAFPLWSAKTSDERAQACVAIADTLEAHADELAHLLTLEQGKPLNGLGSRFEIGGAVAWARHTASLDLPVEVLQNGPEGRVELHRKPIGVVASITPWNWPVMIAIWHIIPAIRVGNTVIIKPSPYTPLSTIRMVQLINEVLPAGVLNVVTGGNELGALLTTHQDIAKITFTGSTATGRKVMASAADTLKRLTLELGGNDAGIVLPDADPNAIAEGLFWGAFINSGQTCACLKRLYVHDSLYDQVCDALSAYAASVKLGDGLAEDSILGPVQNKMQYDIVSSYVQDAVDRGGRVLIGGAPKDGKGYFYPITLVADIDHGAKLVDHEQFGPALPIIRYTDLDQVIAKANDNPAGLGGSVWSSDPVAAKAVAARLECGSVWINKHGAIQPNAPFGGVKQSGIGVEFGADGLKELTTIQSVFC
ncbi:aldehyde dehydrogenase family protein [Agrobacterium vitis]|uniref:Aldehyde dehydrogenase family protein n=1 Tax=Agrobacterium vitis TaxID=373 RepID=A0A368NMF7_AGRVI|nr:aldehyde dehydrogenase family protein [Agrobacterium vitis]KAA3509810.1 aldehyde dehydrogenase family protein [Agrobacterium vitis]KAA3523432.1 aldehyde dehydrogenase family protein [Agrobacterium vitis]MCF1479037.1 aldehyde dehydrogenase family protein [Agrobacterium vitis]MUZ99665.1 aldehyde dehydrogenase family protein [Agrobacterium vitis]MVA30825.1 aldehyde dehydrogenase family protein [Agrobacterium vitis]